MNLDGMRISRADDVVDAVVIGTGAGGAPLLARLAAAGLRVVALEAGGNWTAEHYPADEIEAAGIYWLGERLSGGAVPQAFGANNSGAGVGGSTLHWGAFCPRADPRDLALRTLQGAGENWPLTYQDLEPFYAEVERFIGVSGPNAYPWDSARHYPLPPVLRNAPAQTMQMACDALGLRCSDAPAAVASRSFQQSATSSRPACINCGYCHQGCRNGAKASMDVTYLPAAIEAGAEIRARSVAHDLEFDASGNITSVIYRHNGIDLRQRCAAVFLCAGAIETARFLLHLGIANSSGQVGRNYMAHVATQVWGTFESEMRPNKGYPSSLITEDMVRPTDAAFVGGYLVQSLGIVPVTWAQQVARGRGLWGTPLVEYLDRYNHVAGLGINGECLPSKDNYLELSNEVDVFGVPKVRVNFNHSTNETALSAHAEGVMRRMWKVAGAQDVWALQRSAHTIGTCRMGSDPKSAVVNPMGKSHDIANLWICDNSIFPSALSANPALTIMALSLRTAEAYLHDRRL